MLVFLEESFARTQETILCKLCFIYPDFYSSIFYLEFIPLALFTWESNFEEIENLIWSPRFSSK